MIRLWLGTLAVAMTVSQLDAAELPKVSGPPPRFAIVAEANPREKTVDLLETTVELVATEEARPVTKNGVTFFEKFVMHKPVWVQRITRLAVTKETEVFDGGNNRLADPEIWKRLKTGIPILLAADGRKVDPAYLAIVEKDAIILANPATVVPPAFVPRPMPPEKLPPPQKLPRPPEK